MADSEQAPARLSADAQIAINSYLWVIVWRVTGRAKNQTTLFGCHRHWKRGILLNDSSKLLSPSAGGMR